MAETQNARAARMAAEWWAERLQHGDKARFMEALQAAVEAELGERGRITLQCDHDPMGPLLEAVLAAGVECRGVLFSARGILPENHVLIVKPHELSPKEGYGAWTAKIPVPAI